MRILAIRGKNLASLAGEFEVDFQTESLAASGLFAICGPTGAGKSTLLDALCLALYDNTPRLRNADGRGVELPDVAKETTLPNDRRNILRRGCGEGFAEVDFVGNDAVAYRARWSVRRARGKAEGKLQQADMALVRITDGQPIGGHLKGEVLRAIVERIGLSFEQFTRAVLLAQNEFFAFLKAGEDERAALLQTLTGTDRFEEISRRAFERNKLEQGKLRTLRDRLADQQPMSAEERARHEAERATVKAETSALAARQASLAARLRWHEELARIRAREAAAGLALEEARARHAQAGERRAHLARIEAVEPARALLAECDRLAAECSRLAAQREGADAAMHVATRALSEAQARFDTARTVLAEAEAAQMRFAPAIVKARELDAQVSALGPERARAIQASQDADSALARARQGVADNAAARRARQREQEGAEKWLSTHAALTPLAEGWLRWDALFAAAAEAHAQCRSSDDDTARLEAQRHAHAQALTEATEMHAAATAAVEARTAETVAATAELKSLDLEAVARRRAELDARREALQAATDAWRSLEDRLTQAGRLDTEAKRLRETAAISGQRLAALRTARPAAEAAATQAERAWRLVFEATGAKVEALRAQLSPGTPCPVCGATEHPYAAHHPALDEALARLAAELDECRKAATDLAVEEQTLTREAASLARQLGEIEPRIDECVRETARAQERWQQAASRLAALGASADDAPAAQVAAWLTRCDDELAATQRELAAQEMRHRSALARQQTAQQALDAARRKSDATREALALHQSAAERTTAALQAAREARAAATQRLVSLLSELDAAHAEPSETWRERWHAEPAAHHESCRRRAAEWLEKRAAATSLQVELARLATEAGGLDELASQAQVRCAEAAHALALLDEALQARQSARRTVFADMLLPPTAPGASPRAAEALAVAEVEAVLAEAVQAARTRQAEEERVLKAAEQRLAHDTAARAQLAAQSAALEAAEAKAASSLAGWLGAHYAQAAEPLDLDAVKALLSHDAAWVSAERQALQQLENAVASAAGGFDQVRTQREAHEASGAGVPPLPEGAPEDTPAAIEAAIAELTTSLAAQRERLGGIEVALRHDDEIRQRAADLVRAIETQDEAARIWWQMNELIGSADGKKFRNYAQQLTLDILLGYANAHLKDLARRYRLERVPQSLALMVIDQDMGDEQRSVHSLSGGESFLVSLALALGLASLSSHRVRVESLFIDEGFGSLDADTLRVAMDALDRLQAMGRKVGVISHVEEMTERISTRIRVRRLAGGQSRVEVIGAR